MINKVKKADFYVTGRKTALVLLTAASLFLQAGCKDDDDDIMPGGGQQTDATAIIPSKDKKYSYKITESDGTTSSAVTSVKSVKDSTGIAVFNIETKTTDADGDNVIAFKAYSQNGITTNEISLPAAYMNLIAELDDNPLVKEIKVTGFPHYQLLENKAELNSTVKFKGEDIKVYVRLEEEDEEGNKISSELEAKITYEDGKVVKVENVTTPAGTFNASKWSYGYTVTMKFYNNGALQETINDLIDVQEWTAPGVGIVKSIETSADLTQSVTELQKID